LIDSSQAYFNKHGAGELWFGIKNSGKVQGLTVSEKTLRDISQAVGAHIEPKIYPHISEEKMDGKSCVKVAFSGGEAPYFAHGRAFMRVADEDRQVSAKELESMILHKNRDLLYWDKEPATETLNDLDSEKVKQFVGRAGFAWDNLTNALSKLELLKDDQLLNAAPLFFRKEPPLQLRCAVFGGTTSSNIIDRHDFDGDILELIEEAQKYILKNIHIGMRLNGLYREDVPEISTPALREAIINAFCHRDYRDPDYVHIAVFKNRVEIRNPGELYDGLTIAKMRKGNISKRRNPLIAELFRRIQMVEAWGRGMPLILDNEPGVTFREIAKIFIAGFDRPSFAESDEEKRGKGSEVQATPQVTRLLAALDGEMDRESLQAGLGLNARKNFRILYLKPALEEQLIEMTIPDKPNSRLQKYRLTEKGREEVRRKRR